MDAGQKFKQNNEYKLMKIQNYEFKLSVQEIQVIIFKFVMHEFNNNN